MISSLKIYVMGMYGSSQAAEGIPFLKIRFQDSEFSVRDIATHTPVLKPKYEPVCLTFYIGGSTRTIETDVRGGSNSRKCAPLPSFLRASLKEVLFLSFFFGCQFGKWRPPHEPI